jgi:hypothetical protein
MFNKHNLIQQTSPAGAMVARKTSIRSLTRLSEILRLWVRAPRGASFFRLFTPLEHSESDSESIGRGFIFLSLFFVAVEQD